MKVNGEHYRTVWMKDSSVFLIDQTKLPFEFEIYESKNLFETCGAIKDMLVRGAGAIGATAGFAMAQAFIRASKSDTYVKSAKREIELTRRTAQNLFYATDRVFNAAMDSQDRAKAAIEEAQKIADEDAEACKKIGEYGNILIVDGDNILTHCNAGWLAFVDYGSALSPIYTATAHRNRKNIKVYVDETRPRSQGARLTAWELKNEDVYHFIIPDNAAAYFMSKGEINIAIFGADRIAANGDVANKIGTFEKAIAAKVHGIPFYVAAPTSTFDPNCKSGQKIPIENRNEDEVLYQTGITKGGKLETILVCSPDSKALNPAFDITPAEYITGIITEKGIYKPSELSTSLQ